MRGSEYGVQDAGGRGCWVLWGHVKRGGEAVDSIGGIGE